MSLSQGAGYATGAIVLAAGQSRRMGTQKLLLPWGSQTVIERVIGVLTEASLAQIVVVTGGSRELVEAALDGLPVTLVYNDDYHQSEMLFSLQIGLNAVDEQIDSALIVLADQPQIEPKIVRMILEQASRSTSALIVPSYQKRRGHPWLVRRGLWPEILAMDAGSETLRDFLNKHAEQIEYLNVESRSVLMDLDTPEDYRQQRPNTGE